MADLMDEEKEALRDRARAVHEHYSAYEALTEAGVEIPEASGDFQMFCIFHENINTPAARYYAGSSRPESHFYCWVCKTRLEGVGIYARRKNLRFVEALRELERRFNIKARDKDAQKEKETSREKGENYVSDKWKDIPTMLALLEKKLVRLRNQCGLIEFVKFSRVLDHVQWDYEKLNNKATPEMEQILADLKERMDNVRDVNSVI